MLKLTMNNKNALSFILILIGCFVGIFMLWLVPRIIHSQFEISIENSSNENIDQLQVLCGKEIVAEIPKLDVKEKNAINIKLKLLPENNELIFQYSVKGVIKRVTILDKPFRNIYGKAQIVIYGNDSEASVNQKIYSGFLIPFWIE